MQNKQLYFRIGLFTSTALLLLVGSLFFLGVADEFEERIHFTTTFSESVQGLTKGAEVKYKGVPIGKVERISIVSGEKLIRVDMSIDPNVFHGFKGIKDEDARLEQIRKFWIKEREAGLCCYLDLAGVTGQRYVEMDYLPLERRRKEPLPELKDPDVVYFPSAPSTFNNIVDSVAVSLNKIAAVDVKKISDNLDKNLTAISVILTDPALKNTIERVENIAKNIETLSSSLAQGMSEKDLKKLSSNLNESLEALNLLARQINSKLTDVDVKALSGEINATMASVQTLLNDLHNDKNDVFRSVQRINMLVDNLNELVEIIKRDPSSLIRGKNTPEVDLKK